MGHGYGLAFTAVNEICALGFWATPVDVRRSMARTVIRSRRKRGSGHVEMRLLLLGLTGTEPPFDAWMQWLARAGASFDAIALRDLGPIELIDDAGGCRYQGLILAGEGLIEMALEPSQRASLERLEQELGLRRLIGYATPGSEHGLQAPHWSGHLDELEATLTRRGREVFPYLRDRLPIDPGSWAHLAAPESAQRFQTLVAGPDGSALVGIHTHDDGREEMVQLFSANSAQVQGQLLLRGQIAWLTGGAYVGFDRNYLSVQIDDVLLRNHSWNVAAHESDRTPETSIRMSARDAGYAARWVRERGLRLDLACNGAGSRDYGLQTGGGSDPLLEALLTHRDAFGWISHTYEHLNLDRVPQAMIEAEIEHNVSWAAEAGIELEPHAVITGEHTGLANIGAVPPRTQNADLAAALAAERVKYLACDASCPYEAPLDGPLPPGTPFEIGTALVVPRHPSALPHDAATQAQVLDRIRSEGRREVHSYSQVVDSEARRIFNSAVSNDPLPHYFHQSNLIGADEPGGHGSPGIVYPLLDAVLDRYAAHVATDVPLVQPTFGEVGRLLWRLRKWRGALAAGSVEASLHGTVVMIVNRSRRPVEVPLTGTSAGEQYAGRKSGWVALSPGKTTVLELQRAASVPAGAPHSSNGF